jgi:hypothetical protein
MFVVLSIVVESRGLMVVVVLILALVEDYLKHKGLLHP